MPMNPKNPFNKPPTMMIKDYDPNDYVQETPMSFQGNGGITSGPNHYPHGIVQHGGMNSPPMAVLTVSDVERLAKAGVKMDYAEVKHCVVPDPPPAREPTWSIHTELAALLVQRWNRLNTMDRDGFEVPFLLSAVRYEDKVHVFVAPNRGQYKAAPVILEDDEKLYPSDALMAKIHLLLETQPKA